MRLVRELTVGDEVKAASAFQGTGGGGEEGMAEADVPRLAGVEGRVREDVVVFPRQAGSDVAPMELRRAGDVFPGAGEGSGVGLEEIDAGDARAFSQGDMAEETPSGAEIRDLTAQGGGEIFSEQGGAGIDVICAEHAGNYGKCSIPYDAGFGKSAPCCEDGGIPWFCIPNSERAALVF